MATATHAQAFREALTALLTRLYDFADWQLARTLAWFQAYGRPPLGPDQAVEEAVQAWLGAQWAEHNRGKAMLAPDGAVGDRAVEGFWSMAKEPASFRRRGKR